MARSAPTATGRSASCAKSSRPPDAALHVGPQFVICETAAIDLAAEVAGTDRLQPESADFMFMARGKVGPFRVDGEALRGRDATRVGVQLTVHDEGNADRMISAASLLFHMAD